METRELARMLNPSTGNFFFVIGQKEFAKVGIRLFPQEGTTFVLGVRLRVKVELPAGVELNVAPADYIRSLFPKVKWTGGTHLYRSYAFPIQLPHLTKDGIVDTMIGAQFYEKTVAHFLDVFEGVEFVFEDDAQFHEFLDGQFKEVLDTMFPDDAQAVVFNFPSAKANATTSKAPPTDLEALGFAGGDGDSVPVSTAGECAGGDSVSVGTGTSTQ